MKWWEKKDFQYNKKYFTIVALVLLFVKVTPVCKSDGILKSFHTAKAVQIL